MGGVFFMRGLIIGFIIRDCGLNLLSPRPRYVGGIEKGGFTLKTRQMFSAHATREEFENGGFTLKTRQMLSLHNTLLRLYTVSLSHVIFSPGI